MEKAIDFKREWDKYGIRMSEEGEVKGSWFVHYSSPDINFRCFDYENNLVWVVKTNNKQEAIEIVNQKRLEFLARGSWGNSQKVKRLTGIEDIRKKKVNCPNCNNPIHPDFIFNCNICGKKLCLSCSKSGMDNNPIHDKCFRSK